MMRLAAAVLLAQGRRGRESIAQQLAQRGRTARVRSASGVGVVAMLVLPSVRPVAASTSYNRRRQECQRRHTTAGTACIRAYQDIDRVSDRGPAVSALRLRVRSPHVDGKIARWRTSHDVANDRARARPAALKRSRTGSAVERREALRRFGVYAACTAPAMTVLLASRQSEAGSFFNNGDANSGGNSGLGGRRVGRRWRSRPSSAAVVAAADFLAEPRSPCRGDLGRGVSPALSLCRTVTKRPAGRRFEQRSQSCQRSKLSRSTTWRWSALRPAAPSRWLTGTRGAFSRA